MLGWISPILSLALLVPQWQASPGRVVDGDTFDASVLIWTAPATLMPEIRVRVSGIDTPELRGKCQPERERAIEARAFTESWLGRAGVVYLRDIRLGMYERVEARVLDPNGRELGLDLVAAGLARVSTGTRKGWCP